MISGIYEIWIEDYFYQGSSNNIEQRIYKHKYYLLKNKHINKKMQNVFNKHKIFEYQILVECDESALLVYEQNYIDENFGDLKYMNLNPIASKPPSSKGRCVSQKTRAKMSEVKKGQGLGSKRTDEEKANMSIAAKAKPNVICSVCSQSLNLATYNRWHLNKCQQG